MARPRRPHIVETKPAPSPVIVTSFNMALYNLALKIAKDRRKIRVVSAGVMEITDLPSATIEKLRREHG